MFGIYIKEIILLLDDRQQFEEVFVKLIEKVDIFIISGGFGFIVDDFMIFVFVVVFGWGVIIDLIVCESMCCKVFQWVVFEVEIFDNFYKQGEVVEGLIVFQNFVGLVLVSLVEIGCGFVVVLLGVFYELCVIFYEYFVDEFVWCLSLFFFRILWVKFMG